MKRTGWVMAASLGALALAATLAGCQKKENQAQPPAKAPAQAAAGPVETPRRKAGLWEISMSSAGVGQTQTVCVDPTTDAKLGLADQPRGAKPCRESKTTRTAAGYEIRTVCDQGEMGVVTSTARLTGDPGSHYRVEVASSTTGARGTEVNGTHNFAMEATWKGPCPAGMKPGDMQVAGHVFNPVDVQRKASGGE